MARPELIRVLLKMRVRVIREAPAVLILIARLEPLEGQ